MKLLERMCILAMEKQADGSKFRLGRLPAKEYWDFGHVTTAQIIVGRRGGRATFSCWTMGFCTSLQDNMLASKIVSVWPT